MARCLNLLLTGNYTRRICQELHIEAIPKIWQTGAIDEKTVIMLRTQSPVPLFHLPFYAGWVVSPEYGIQRGEVRGQWFHWSLIKNSTRAGNLAAE
jgi:hypothetical protein